MSRKTQSGPRSTVVLIGLMGSGKTSIGRRLAARLGIQFIDADTEIEAAAGSSIHDIFELHGEQAFRDGERRVIARLLDGPVHVLATGGGAFMTDETRARISDSAVSVWMRASLDTLVKRVERSRTRRPLLEAGDPREILSALVDERYPVYGEADIIVETGEGPHEPVVESIVQELRAFWQSSGDDVDGDDDDTQDSSVPSDQETE
ncbi:MAG: shikimate kinase [Alphaproteobacteria bacterium]|nr:shikimate kinase [Alphaproteobacteria bacterium]